MEIFGFDIVLPGLLYPIGCRRDNVEIPWKTSSYLYGISTISNRDGAPDLLIEHRPEQESGPAFGPQFSISS